MIYEIYKFSVSKVQLFCTFKITFFMKKILFISPMHFGLEHVPFEVSIIKLYMNMYPEASFVYSWESTHATNILLHIPSSSRIEIKAVKTTNRHKIIWYTFLIALLRRKHRIVYLALDPFYLYFLLPFVRVEIWFMHKYYPELRHWYGRLVNFCAFKFFLLFHRHAKIIVLWEWIFDKILEDSLLTLREKKQFHWIDHPYFFSPMQVFLWNNSKISFGFLWRQKSATYKKTNSTHFSDIISLINLNWGKALFTWENFVSSDDYYDVLYESDCLVFLAPENSYKFRCSGVFIEALVFQKIIICFSNPLTNYFFSRHGNIGYKCNSLSDLKNVINKICSDGLWIMDIQKKNLRTASMQYSNMELFIWKFFDDLSFI